MDDDVLTPAEQRERDAIRANRIRGFLVFYVFVALFGFSVGLFGLVEWVTRGPEIHRIALAIIGLGIMTPLSYFGFRNDTAYIYGRMNKPLYR